jgi:hypothetical protein
LISYQSPVTLPRLTLDIWFLGFDRACKRFYRGMPSHERGAASIPLYEALNWAVAIDDQLQERWLATPTTADPHWADGFIHGDTVKGVRWARNVVHHQWTAAMYMTRSGLPADARPDEFEWRWMWKLADDPKKARPQELANAYYWKVGGRPVRKTLGELSLCFADAAAALVSGSDIADESPLP